MFAQNTIDLESMFKL